MKDNARHVPGSTRSRRTPLSRSPTPARRFQIAPEKCVHYAYKMRPNFKMQNPTRLFPTTYNFNASKCTDFTPLNLNLTPNLNLSALCSPSRRRTPSLLPRGEG